MCGINGYLQFEKERTKQQIEHIVNEMNNRIIHRGPDDEGTFADNFIGLGMRRLSIIDLSTGKQPIFNEDRSMVIVFNGEIYNYKSIRKELISKGYIFTTNSDTEVILHAYEEYGNKCFDILDGMFSLAIYNLITNKLIIARDRVGEKPLYYYHDDEKFIFGSEIKSLLSTNVIVKKVNKTALAQYLQLTYIPAPLTIFETIYKLEPGCHMEIENKAIQISRYWNVEYNRHSLIHDYDTCKTMLRKSLFESVEKRMIADVPLGAFLSGGIDSTTIVGIMSKMSIRPVETFTIGFESKEYDESNRAKLASDYHKTNHHVYFLNYDKAIEEIDTILDNMDEPFADSSAIPTAMVSKYASKYVKVVLTGDSGDELFGGYNKYLIGYYTQRYNSIPQVLRKSIIEKVIYSLPDRNSITRKIRKVIDNADKDIFEQRKELMCLGFKENELSLLVNEKYRVVESINFIKKYYDTYENKIDELSKALYMDFKVVLEGDMLTKVDRHSMLNSIEARVPLLSKDVIELAAKIPSDFKITSTQQKKIFKDTFADLIPKELLNASKMGFSVPIGSWFNNQLKGKLLTILDEEFIEEQQIFNYGYIAKILDEHFTGEKNRTSELWILFVFQNWYRKYFE